MSKKPDRRPALGRGLSALIPEDTSPAPSSRERPPEVDLDRIDPNPQQPRLAFDEASLDELAASIRISGLVQPIIVRRHEGRYQIVAGERRWRAAQRAGLLRVPVVVRDVPDEKLLELALIENIQRENLNAIDEALAYRKLADTYDMTQEQIAAAVGKDRTTVANHMRLLRLPEHVRREVASGALSMGHARALLGLEDPDVLAKAAAHVLTRSLSVRETEALVRKLSAGPKEPPPPAPKDVHTREAEEKLRLRLGTRVGIRRSGKGGRIEIDFVNENELIRLYEILAAV
jgi:ParB family transcriptional regulator, chromosome partitioning protein